MKVELVNILGGIVFTFEKENNTIKETIEEAIKAGISLVGLKVTDADLSGINLSHKDLTNAIFTNVKMQGAVLRYTNFHSAGLRDVDLLNANIIGGIFSNTRLSNVNFDCADLRQASFCLAHIFGSRFCSADISSADFTGSFVKQVNFNSAHITSIIWDGCRLLDVKFRFANFCGREVNNLMVFTGLYKYIVVAYITEYGKARVRMGCFDRSVKEWDEDFWNNDYEFPNDNSIYSNLRLMAYNTAKNWLEIIKRTAEE